MNKQSIQLGDCQFEVLTDAGDGFVGLGAISIGDTKVRSGRLPIRPYSQSFKNHELDGLKLLGIDKSDKEIRLKIEATFRPMRVQIMRDHSFDPIHDTTDWDQSPHSGKGRLDLVIRPASDKFNNVELKGFSYHWDYKSENVPLFYILDQASWELDGDIIGATVISQSSCSAPVATFSKPDTAWTTEGVIHWEDVNSLANPVMTHNLPRWASHGSFDFQFKGDKTLVGVFDHVDLIRTILKREPNKPELKTFDKHIFDQTTSYTTSPKKILLNTQKKSLVAQRNLWSWMFEDIHDRARAEFGLKLEPMLPRLSINFWHSFTVDSYYRDLVPAAASLGIRQIFVDNLNKNDMSEGVAKLLGSNMCCGQEYELAPSLGGTKRVKEFVERCKEHNIQVMSWTNNDQSYLSPINRSERDQKGWYVKMEDTRLKYGGAYTNVFNILDFSVDDARNYWRDCLKKTREESGLNGYLFDSFYNLGFMPVSYAGGKPHTMWRQTLAAFKELQEADVHFLIESFGPFGQPQHGCPSSYNVENIYAVYRVGLGNDYTTVPTNHPVLDTSPKNADALYYVLAHMANPNIPLHIDGKRIDQVWGEPHRQALKDFHENSPHMRRRFLQEDGKSVLWHDEKRERATIFNFAERQASLPGKVKDVTTGKDLPKADKYKLEAYHTYVVTGGDLPVNVG